MNKSPRGTWPAAIAFAMAASLIGPDARAQCDLWQSVGSGITGTEVNALAVYNNELIVGGKFTNAGGQAANHIARWNGTSWQTLGTGMGGADPVVYALTVYNGDLIVGGLFATAGGIMTNNIARWNGSTWSAFPGSNIGTNNVVRALTVHSGSLIVAGQFTNAGGQPAQKIARFDSGWNALGGGLTGPGSIAYSLVSFNGALIAGGMFSSAGGGMQDPHNIARWNGSSWSLLDHGLNDNVFALASYNNELIAGGSFLNAPADGSSVPYIARWTGFSWATLGGPAGTGMNNAVRALAVFNGELIAAGDFTVAGSTFGSGGVSAARIARWNGTAWNALGSVGSGMNNSVRALGTFNVNLIAGGLFDNAGGQSAARVARWNGCPPCPPDTNHDGVVNVTDLLGVINSWGSCPAPPNPCAGDVAPPGGDGVVNVSDLLAVINGWGACP